MSELSGEAKKKTSKLPWYRATWVFPTTVVVVAGVIAIALFVAVWWPCNIDDISGKLTLTVGIFGGLLFVLNFVINHRRTVALEDQLKTQREQLKDQRESDRRRDQQQLYATNVQHLGSISESVRIGAIYGLERLAKDSKDSAETLGIKNC